MNKRTISHMTLDNAIDRFRERPSRRTAIQLRRVVGEYLRDDMIGTTTHEYWTDQTRDYVIDAKENES
jgi:hypothetical protein